jgi:hypothetical protein
MAVNCSSRFPSPELPERNCGAFPSYSRPASRYQYKPRTFYQQSFEVCCEGKIPLRQCLKAKQTARPAIFSGFSFKKKCGKNFAADGKYFRSAARQSDKRAARHPRQSRTWCSHRAIRPARRGTESLRRAFPWVQSSRARPALRGRLSPSRPGASGRSLSQTRWCRRRRPRSSTSPTDPECRDRTSPL